MGTAASEKSHGKRSWKKLFWGSMAFADNRIRITALVFVAASIASMSYTQLGFWSIGIIDEKPVYLMLLLGPLAMGAMMFGPLMGCLLGLFTGAVVFLHATFIPLDFYEVYFMTPFNTFVTMAIIGAIAGLLFKFVQKRQLSGGARVAAIAGTCMVLSFAASGLETLGTIVSYGGLATVKEVSEFLLNSPLGIVMQALIDGILMAVLCIAADIIERDLANRSSERRLLGIFRAWMLAVSSIVFIVASAILFTCATWYATEEAATNMMSEVDYLKNQLNLNDDNNLDTLLEGYTVEIDGQVAILDKHGIILASDDEKLPVGESFIHLIGYGSPDGDEAMAKMLFETDSEEGEDERSQVARIEAQNDKGQSTMGVKFLAAGSFDEGYIAIVYTSEMVYSIRFGIMAAVTVLAIALIVAIALLASNLLKQVVIRRIDETNTSLEKITDGNLNERVRVRDSMEFLSLSNGINTTVGALKNTIDEIAQKNAQDLATAKAIQESALPRDFPPFPDIDRFDIYASMKTAKEVGGDFYNFFLIDKRHLGFMIADVSGKGIPAALFMMTAKTQLQNYMESGLPVNEAVDAANHQLCIGNDAGMFVTAFICVLDYETGMLTYVNAGHNPPMLRRGDTWEWVRNVSGMPLGLFDGIPYDRYELQLEKDEILYLYTDGVTEAMSVDGELFTEERLEKVLYRLADLNPRSICTGIRRALTDYTINAEQSDDITMLCLKYGVPPEKRAYMILPALDTQLIHVYNFIHEELHRRNAPDSAYNPLDIATEELFVNVCHYAYPDATPENPGEVRIGFEYEANPPSLTVTISDDGIPYNPLAKPESTTADQYDDINDIPIGGLGILMAKRCVDAMEYDYVDGSNVLTFRKGW